MRTLKFAVFPVLTLSAIAIPAMRLRGEAHSAPLAAPLEVYPLLRDSSITIPADSAITVVSADLVFPVAKHEVDDVISKFGDARDGGRRSHLGIDIAAPRGTAVLAVSAGRVERVDHTGAGGRVVWVKDAATRRRHYFAHLDSITVTRGQKVRAGQMVGTVGTTGNAVGTSPHLHYAVRDGDDVLDPMSLFDAKADADDNVGSRRTMRARLSGAALKTRPGGVTIAVLKKGETVQVKGETGRYYRVRYRGRDGYLPDWLLQ